MRKKFTIDEFCEVLHRYAPGDEIIEEIQTGSVFDFGILTPAKLKLENLEYKESEIGRFLIPKDDLGVGVFCFPSIINLSEEYWYRILYIKPFWILLRISDKNADMYRNLWDDSDV